MSEDNPDDLLPVYRDGAEHTGYDLYLRNREDTSRTDWHIEVAAPSPQAVSRARSEFARLGWRLDGKPVGRRFGSL